MTGHDAITALTTAFSAPGAVRATQHAESADVVVASPHIPVELLRAAGRRPRVVRGSLDPTPLADAHLEPHVFPNRIRQLVELVLAGRLDAAAAILLPRTSEADYKGFLYLRELVRREVVLHPHRILLVDLLQSDGAHVAAHNAQVVRQLWAACAPHGAADTALRDEIARTNAARAAVRRLLALRAGSPRVTGSEVLPLIGAFWCLPPDVYARLATAAVDHLAARPPLDQPRVLLLGAPVDGPGVHAAIEGHGAVVVSEVGPWGTNAAATDVDEHGDPFDALATTYSRDAWGPRTPIATVRDWVSIAIASSDAVVVLLPPDDGVFGWDYPWLRDRLQSVGVPHICLAHDGWTPLTPADHQRLARLVATAVPRLEARRG